MRSVLKHIVLLSALVLSLEVSASDSLIINNVKNIITFNVDNKGNFFVADQANSLIKLDSNGTEITRVNTKVYGRIHSIDCSNPFEIYVYHKAQNVLVFYDNMLNNRGEMRLNDLGYDNIACVARSFDNAVWLFDYNDFELKKVRKDGILDLSSGNVLTFTEAKLNPSAIQEIGKNVMLIDSSVGIMMFDIFGTWTKNLALKGASSIYVFDQNIYLLKPTSDSTHDIWRYNTLSLSYQKSGSMKNVEDIICGFKKKLFFSRKNIVYIR